jgi:Cu(I)/Ag(I) efflux system membrane fusion protein
MRTEIDVPNADGKLYPGMYAQVSLETEVHRHVLTVPASAVANGGYVLVVREERIVQQPVKTGIAQGGAVEVEGIAENADVVRTAQGAPAVGTMVKTASPR